MNKFNDIIDELRFFKKQVDVIVANYQKTDKERKETYSEKFYETERAKNLAAAQVKLAEAQRSARFNINRIIKEIQQGLKEWVSTPITKSSLDMLVALDSMNVTLTATELETLAETVPNNYFAGKMIEHLANKNKITSYRFSQIKIDDYTSALSRVIGSSEMFIKNYCGEKHPFCYELFGKENPPTSKTFVAIAGAGTVFESNSFLYASSLWSGGSIPDSKQRKELTKANEAALDKIFSGCKDEDSFQKKMDEVLFEAPYLKEKIELSKYSKYLSDEPNT